jgi:hypothetical protein
MFMPTTKKKHNTNGKTRASNILILDTTHVTLDLLLVPAQNKKKKSHPLLRKKDEWERRCSS